MTNAYVYAIGRIEPRFPRLAVEKEFAQVTGRTETAGLTDRQVLQTVLGQRQNRYLARQLCWVFTIEGLETYILQPRDPADLDLLVDAVRPTPSPLDVDVIIGVRGPIAPPELCNGLMVPIVVFDQLYSFDRDSLIKAIPRPEKVTAKQFETVSGELFERVLQMADNAQFDRIAPLVGHLDLGAKIVLMQDPLKAVLITNHRDDRLSIGVVQCLIEE